MEDAVVGQQKREGVDVTGFHRRQFDRLVFFGNVADIQRHWKVILQLKWKYNAAWE